jgi:hypothetical protein
VSVIAKIERAANQEPANTEEDDEDLHVWVSKQIGCPSRDSPPNFNRPALLFLVTHIARNGFTSISVSGRVGYSALESDPDHSDINFMTLAELSSRSSIHRSRRITMMGSMDALDVALVDRYPDPAHPAPGILHPSSLMECPPCTTWTALQHDRPKDVCFICQLALVLRCGSRGATVETWALARAGSALGRLVNGPVGSAATSMLIV